MTGRMLRTSRWRIVALVTIKAWGRSGDSSKKCDVTCFHGEATDGDKLWSSEASVALAIV